MDFGLHYFLFCWESRFIGWPYQSNVILFLFKDQPIFEWHGGCQWKLLPISYAFWCFGQSRWYNLSWFLLDTLDSLRCLGNFGLWYIQSLSHPLLFLLKPISLAIVIELANALGVVVFVFHMIDDIVDLS